MGRPRAGAGRHRRAPGRRRAGHRPRDACRRRARPAAGNWRVRDLDLQRVHSSLIATRLSGTVARGGRAVDADRARRPARKPTWRSISPPPSTGKRIDIERFRGRAGGGEVDRASGRVTLDARARLRGHRATQRTSTRRDSARCPPAASTARSRRADAGAALERRSATSRWRRAAGSQASPSAGNCTRTRRAQGGAQRRRRCCHRFGDDLAPPARPARPATSSRSTVDAPRLQDLRGLLARLRRRRDSRRDRRSAACSRHGDQRARRQRPRRRRPRATRCNGESCCARERSRPTPESRAGGLTLDPAANATRRIALKLAATRVSAPQGELATLAVDGAGTLAHHTVTFALNGEGVDAHARFTGGFRDPGAPSSGVGGFARRARQSRRVRMQLDAPATIEWARDRVHVGTRAIARRRRPRRPRTSFAGTKEASRRAARSAASRSTRCCKLAGVTSPLASTMVIGGDWSLAASPHLNGTLHVRRERGDWFGTESATSRRPAICARHHGARRRRAVRRRQRRRPPARCARCAPATPTQRWPSRPRRQCRGRIAFDAPMTATLSADLPSLRPLQPWLGTLAVIDGRAHVDVTGSGTLANAVLAGTLTADAVARRRAAVRRALAGRPPARALRRPVAGPGRPLVRRRRWHASRRRERSRARRPAPAPAATGGARDVEGGQIPRRESSRPAARRRRQRHAGGREQQARVTRQRAHRRRPHRLRAGERRHARQRRRHRRARAHRG